MEFGDAFCGGQAETCTLGHLQRAEIMLVAIKYAMESLGRYAGAVVAYGKQNHIRAVRQCYADFVTALGVDKAV